MKKLFSIFALCLLLLTSCAFAEDYVAGETATALLTAANEEGKLVGGELTFQLEAVPGAAISSNVPMEDLQEILQSAHLSVHGGRIQDGIRFELAGTYAPEGSSEKAQLTAAVTLREDGVELESNLLEGKRITAKWETVFALIANFSDDPEEVNEMIAVLKMLESADVDYGAIASETIQNAAAAVEVLPEVASELLAPYITTISDFVATLDVQKKENIPEQDIFPAAEHEMIITFTSAQLSDLFNTLADQIENDAQLAAFAEGTDDLAADLRLSASNLAVDNSTYVSVIDYNDSRLPLSFLLSKYAPDGSSTVVMLLLSPDESGLGTDILVNLYNTDANGTLDNDIVLAGCIFPSPDGKSFDIEAALNASENNVDYLMADFAFKTAPLTGGLPGSRTDLGLSLAALENQSQISYLFSLTSSKTDKDGETFQLDGTFSIGDATLTIAQDVQMGMTVDPAEDGFDGLLWMFFASEDLGLNKMGLSIALNTFDYEPAELTEITLETVTNDEMNALVIEAQHAVLAQANLLLNLLPESVVQVTPVE